MNYVKKTQVINLEDLSTLKVSPSDTNEGYLESKITEGLNIDITKQNIGENENLIIDIGNNVTTNDGTQTLSNKTINADNNTIQNITINNFKNGVIDIDLSTVSTNDDTIPSAKAVRTEINQLKTYTDQLLNANDAMIFKGTIDCSANPNFPSANAGHVYKVSVSGKIGGMNGINVEAGDSLYCIIDNSLSGTYDVVGVNWVILQANIDGAVVGGANSTDNAIVRYDGATGKLIQNSNVSIDDNGSVNIPTGQSYKINNSDINTAGTLSNVVYTSTDQTIGGNKTFNNPIKTSTFNGDKVIVSDLSKNIVESSVTTTELGYLSGVTSSIQSQLDSKVDDTEVSTVATPNKLLKLDSNSKLPASITGNSETATKLATARNISLSGDVNGSVLFNGETDVTITTTVNDNSHNHIWANITDKPSSLPADGGNSDTVDGKHASDFANTIHTHTKSQITDFPLLATVSTSGDYNDLINTPTIPSSLPASGGNADTVDNKHASDFMQTTHPANVITGLGTSGVSNNVSRSDHNHDNSYVSKNSDIVGATKAKITYDSKGLVIGGSDLTASDIPTLTLSKISDVGTVANKNVGTSSGNIPVLDSNGKLDSSILPAIAITNTFVVNSEVSMLGLTAEIGDVAVRTDLSKSFILKVTGANILSNWQELLTPTDLVSSVNGKTGVVTLNASDVGAIPTSHPTNNITGFGGDGTATTVSRADHNHNGTYDNYGSWTLQGNGANGSSITSGATVNITGNGATSVTKSGNTITVSSTDTNTWRPISDSVNTTDSSTSASLTAVKTAYDLANSKWTYNEGAIQGIKVNNATNADNADTLDGKHAYVFMQNQTVASGVDLNTLTTAGSYRLSNGHVNAPTGADWSQLLVIYGGSDTIAQILVSYSTGKTFTRSGNPSNVGGNGSWTAWKELASTDMIPTSLPANGGNSDTLDEYHASISVSPNTVVVRDANNYIYANYINSNRGAENTPASQYIYDNGDGWMRKKDINNVRTELCGGNIGDQNLDMGISKMLRWKNYGNGHVIFDASNGTSPTGSVVDKTNSQIVWSATYPTLMGWNGSNTYGVRVDSARVADSAVNADTLDNKHASDFAPSGYGLGASVEISGADLNNYISTGFYKGSGLVNAPNNGWFWIITQSHDSSWSSQMAVSYGSGNAQNIVYIRTLSSGSWSAWSQLAKTTDIPSKLSQLTNDIGAGASMTFVSSSATPTAKASQIWVNTNV